MTSTKPLLYSVGIVLFVGFVIPFFLGFFIDLDSVELSPLASSLVTVVESGFELDVIPLDGWGEFDINPFSWMGGTLHTYFINAVTYLGLLPEFILIPLLILTTLSIIVSIISLLPTT